MDHQKIFWGSVAISSMLMPLVGLLIGIIRMKRYGPEVMEKCRQDYERAMEKGGFSELFYKRWKRRYFEIIFGVPMRVGFLIGLALLLFALYKL